MECIRMSTSFNFSLHSKAPCEDEDEVSASSESLGEQLFVLVDIYNTGYSQKITGK